MATGSWCLSAPGQSCVPTVLPSPGFELQGLYALEMLHFLEFDLFLGKFYFDLGKTDCLKSFLKTLIKNIGYLFHIDLVLNIYSWRKS